MKDILTPTPEADPSVAVARLALYLPEPIDEYVFAKDNYFNALGKDKLRTSAPMAELFSHVVRVGTDISAPGMDKYLGSIEERLQRHPREVKPLADDSRIERLLETFDLYMFDKYGYTFTFQTEAVTNFGRYAVYSALEDTLHEAV